ncbi:MAG: TonB family protein [Candidatus Sulfotelmatobacter sp.]
MVKPIWQVLADLEIEGEYCSSAVDAVERVTTQMFQIVITDWEDQPEAAFLLKTARDLKAAHRPLTLAIVSDDARLPEALQAGANSVLMKPIRTEQVRDTMSTACELLRSKMQPDTAASSKASAPTAVAAAAAASSGVVSAPPISASAAASARSAPVSVTTAPENAFRAGEFLQSQSSVPGTHFDTECDVQKSLDQAAAAEVDALTELEPVASAVAEAPVEPVETQEPVEKQEPLTGWVALQARLTKSAPPPAKDDSATSELLSHGETHTEKPASRAQADSPNEAKKSEEKQSQPESAAEAALFAYMAEGSKPEPEPLPEPQPKRIRNFLVGTVALVSLVLVATPRTRQSLGMLYRDTLHAGGSWLNPQPVVIIQAAPQHENFGQAGDEYKLPTPANIPDATTDPSQIRVLPVIDPTAKTPKGSGVNSGQAQATTGDTNATDQGPDDQNQASQGQTQPDESAQPQAAEPQIHEQGVPAATDTRENATAASAPKSSATDNAPVVQAPPPPQRAVTPPVQPSAPPHVVSAANNGMIPMSLKSQTASMTPESSGAMPVEAAMSSIEPVKLTESVARGLLTQSVDPAYPNGGKAGGQRGSVLLQVLIGRDGSVQDAMFMQGSLVFARAAITAVKQWRFKPYLLNGRPVAVQSLITLNFKPPA